MKSDLQTIIFTVIFFIFTFIFGAIAHSLITLILSFLILHFLLNFQITFSIFFAILISGSLNMIFNFRVFLEALIVEIEGKDGILKYWKEISKYKKDEEKYRASVSIELDGKSYKVIEFAKYFFDPRAKNKNDLKGFLIFSEEDKNKQINLEIKRKVLGIYLFQRHIYFEDILGKNIPLKSHSKKIFKYMLKFQEAFKKQIGKRMEDNYLQVTQLKNKEFSDILKNLDEEVYAQYPFVKEKLEIEISIFDSLYKLFTKPSDKIYENLMNKIERIAELSVEENKSWSHRLTTWNNLVKHYDLKIENLPNVNFKKTGLSAFKDLISYYLTKQKPIISEETIKSLIVEGTKIPRKKILKFLNNYLVLHKAGIDAIKLNIEVNKKFKDLLIFHRQILNNPPIHKIRN